MATAKANDCRGCAECVHCGLDEEYDVLKCDQCEQEFDELAEIDGQELCPECLWNYVEKRRLYA